MAKVLYINTADPKIVTVSLKEKGKIIKTLSEKNEYGSEILLPLITDLIIKFRDRGKMLMEDLTGIEVETGPGSFTGLRVGTSVANALGFALNVPINGKKMETELKY